MTPWLDMSSVPREGSEKEGRVPPEPGSSGFAPSPNGLGPMGEHPSRTLPVRLRLSRKKGFSLQAWSQEVNGLPAVNVARPSKWGNPHKVGADETYYGGPGHERVTAVQCVELYREHIEAVPPWLPPVSSLRGKNLACYCALGAPCHADVLLTLANPDGCHAMWLPSDERAA